MNRIELIKEFKTLALKELDNYLELLRKNLALFNKEFNKKDKDDEKDYNYLIFQYYNLIKLKNFLDNEDSFNDIEFGTGEYIIKENVLKQWISFGIIKTFLLILNNIYFNNIIMIEYATTELHIINDVLFNDKTFEQIDTFMKDNKNLLENQTLDSFLIFFN